MTTEAYCAKMWLVPTSSVQRLRSSDYLLLGLPNYLIVTPDGSWEFGHAMQQDTVYGNDGYLLAAIGRMRVPSWIQLV